MQLKPHTKHSVAKHDEKNSSTKTDIHIHTHQRTSESNPLSRQLLCRDGVWFFSSPNCWSNVKFAFSCMQSPISCPYFSPRFCFCFGCIFHRPLILSLIILPPHFFLESAFPFNIFHIDAQSSS